MTVYVDILLVVNLYVNYILLLCTSRIIKADLKRLRLLGGSAFGSCYSLIIFVPSLHKILLLLSEIAVCIVIILICFGFINVRRFVRCTATFFAVNLGFAGVMYLLWTFAAPSGMFFQNGVAYFNIDLKILAVSTVVCFITVSVINFFMTKNAPKNCIYSVTIYNNGKKAELTALSDTGNSLRESFSGFPVFIAELNSVKAIAPQCVIDYINGNENITDGEMRIVAQNTINGCSLSPAFKPDRVEIKSLSKNLTVKNIYIAVTKQNIGNGEFQVILNPTVFEEAETNDEID